MTEAALVKSKMAIPTVGWLARCKDTEGNVFETMQMDLDPKRRLRGTGRED